MTLAGLLLAATACEQQSQRLPFDVEVGTTRTLPAEGGAVSTPAGAAIDFPDGSLGGPLAVSLTPTSAPTAIEGLAASGAFSIEPAQTVLNGFADLELRLSSNLPPGSAWLTSLVGSTGTIVTEIAGGRVDLSTGVFTTPISHFGTYVAVDPPSSVVFPVQTGGAALSLTATDPAPSFLGVTVDSVTAGCGGPGDRCVGVSADATSNLLDLVESAALLYPVVGGSLKVGVASVTGSLTARGTLRVLFESGMTAESVDIHAVLQPTSQTIAMQTSNELRLTNMLHRVSGGAYGTEAAVEEIATLVIPLTGEATGRVAIRRTFDIRVAGGVTQPAMVAFTFPVKVFE